LCGELRAHQAAHSFRLSVHRLLVEHCSCFVLTCTVACAHRHNIIKQNYKHNKLRQHFEQYGKLLTPGAIDLLEKMLCLDPKKRIDAITAFGVRRPRNVIGLVES